MATHQHLTGKYSNWDSQFIGLKTYVLFPHQEHLYELKVCYEMITGVETKN